MLFFNSSSAQKGMKGLQNLFCQLLPKQISLSSKTIFQVFFNMVNDQFDGSKLLLFEARRQNLEIVERNWQRVKLSSNTNCHYQSPQHTVKNRELQLAIIVGGVPVFKFKK